MAAHRARAALMRARRAQITDKVNPIKIFGLRADNLLLRSLLTAMLTGAASAMRSLVR